jgi:hypothetical protein
LARLFVRPNPNKLPPYRDRYGPHSERTARLLDQVELLLEELESSATEDGRAASCALDHMWTAPVSQEFLRV